MASLTVSQHTNKHTNVSRVLVLMSPSMIVSVELVVVMWFVVRQPGGFGGVRTSISCLMTHRCRRAFVAVGGMKLRYGR